MASDRQIAANRRNAQKSTGPRSVQGKRRASGNAYRHGLAAGSRQPGKNAAAIDALASEIATTATGSVLAALDLEVLQHARTAAEAELDLLRIRAIKAVAMRSLTAAVDAPMSGPLHGNEVRRIGDPLPALSPKCAMSSPPASKPPLQNDNARSNGSPETRPKRAAGHGAARSCLSPHRRATYADDRFRTVSLDGTNPIESLDYENFSSTQSGIVIGKTNPICQTFQLSNGVQIQCQNAICGLNVGCPPRRPLYGSTSADWRLRFK